MLADFNFMNWSIEQQAIFGFYATGEGNLVIEANAGTGKTTTIKAAFEHAPEKRILYAVFNKRNQREAQEKITDSRVDVKTLHSLGYFFIKRVWRNAKPDDFVEFFRVENLFPKFSREEVSAMVKLVGFAKNSTIQTTVDDLYRIAEDQDIELSVDIIPLAMQVLEASKIQDVEGRISFNDMVWLPVAMNWVKPIYDLVTIDEAQDMNLPQLMMARQASSGRVVVVGDSRQAIYGFRGAVQNGMSMMKNTLRAQVLKLSTTYRCPKAVVALAAEIVPDYKAAPEAPEGSVERISEKQMDLKPLDAILSRLNAPLMPLALSLLRRNIPARIEGRDIGKQLIGMVKTMKAKSVPHFFERIEAWATKQGERFRKARNAEKKLEQIKDIAETLKAIAESASSVSDIEVRINNLFQDSDATSKPAVVLSTVHKAKGLEWRNVFMLADTFRRGKGIEEDNIFYVAVTRSQDRLFLVSGGASIVSQPSQEKPATTANENPTGDSKATIDTPLTGEVVAVSGEDKLDNYRVPSGLNFHEIGNVIRHGGIEFICTKVNDCSAIFTAKDRSTIRLSSTCEPSAILRKIDLKEFFARNGVHSAKEITNPDAKEKNSMKQKTTTEPKQDKLSFIVALAQAGKTDEQIKSEVKKTFGEITAHYEYISGREWRRVNKAKDAAAIPAKVAKAEKTPVVKPVKKTPPAKPAKVANN